MLDNAAIQVDEAAGAARPRAQTTSTSIRTRSQALERRLGRMHELARKHRVPPEQLAAQRDAHRRRTGSAARRRRAPADARRRDRSRARTPGARRPTLLGAGARDAAASLSQATTALIAELGMGGGRFEVALEPIEADRPDPQGGERVEFLVAANPGQPPRPLRKVASGGELSRISLAIEVAALGLDAVPTMVFDEVDSGIGGARRRDRRAEAARARRRSARCCA